MPTFVTFDNALMTGNIRSDDSADIGTHGLELVVTPTMYSQYIQPKVDAFNVVFGSDVGGGSCSFNQVFYDPADHEFKEPL